MKHDPGFFLRPQIVFEQCTINLIKDNRGHVKAGVTSHGPDFQTLPECCRSGVGTYFVTLSTVLATLSCIWDTLNNVIDAVNIILYNYVLPLND
jgi:hypothetical protein